MRYPLTIIVCDASDKYLPALSNFQERGGDIDHINSLEVLANNLGSEVLKVSAEIL